MNKQQWVDYVARKIDGGGLIDGDPRWPEKFEGTPSGGPALGKRECVVCGGPRHQRSWICATCFNAVLLGYLPKVVVEGPPELPGMRDLYRYYDPLDKEHVAAVVLTTERSPYQGESSQHIARCMRMNQDDELRPKEHLIDQITIRNAPSAYDQMHRFAPCGRRFNLKKNWSYRDKRGVWFLRPERTSQYKKLCGPPIKVNPLRLVNLPEIPTPPPMVPQFPPKQQCLGCERMLPGYWTWQGAERFRGKCPNCILAITRSDAIRNAAARHKKEVELMPDENPMEGIIDYSKFCFERQITEAAFEAIKKSMS